MKGQCNYLGCAKKATIVVNANDGTKNKYLACDEHKNEFNVITMQGTKAKI